MKSLCPNICLYVLIVLGACACGDDAAVGGSNAQDGGSMTGGDGDGDGDTGGDGDGESVDSNGEGACTIVVLAMEMTAMEMTATAGRDDCDFDGFWSNVSVFQFIHL